MRVNVALVGGGLANCLIAYRLRTQRPDVDVLLLERETQLLAGRRTWLFHTNALSAEEHEWLAALVEHSWPHHEVRLPAFSRRLQGGYHSVTSERVRDAVSVALGRRLWLQAEATHLSQFEVQVQDGNRIAADAVIDGRGDPGSRHLELGYLQLLGQTVVLENAHGLEGPILMDATVPQLAGYRFVSTLPLSSHAAVLRDTRYGATPGLDRESSREAIRDYARSQGWQVKAVESEAEGILPIVLGGDIEGFWGDGSPGVPRSGMRAALFHPTTGHSLPEAVRLADAIAAATELRSPALYALTRERSFEAWRRGSSFRRLNRMSWGQV